MDGETMQEVASVWRRFDGYPSVHLAEVKSVLAGRKYLNMMGLMADLLSGFVSRCPRDQLWQFVPVNRTEPDLFPCYLYEVWLEYKPRWFPRSDKVNGIPCVAVYLPKKLGEYQPGKRFYSGALSAVNPKALDDEINTFEEARLEREEAKDPPEA
jgi:hypothetical protein